MSLDLSALRLFREVARAGSMSAAARTLGMSQSTVSVAVNQLEEAVGITLLHRGSRGVSATEAGELLLRRAEDLLGLVDDVVGELNELQDDEVGSFVIGCHDALGSYFLPAFLPDFVARHPRIELTLWNRSSAEVREAVLARDVHFGLVVNTEPHDDLVIRRAWTDRIEVFGPANVDDPMAAFRSGTLVYPNREPFLTLLGRLDAEGVAPARRLPCGDLGLTRILARALGFGLLPRRVALDGDLGLRSLSDELPRHDDVIHLVTRADLPRTKGTRVLRDALMAKAAAM